MASIAIEIDVVIPVLGDDEALARLLLVMAQMNLSPIVVDGAASVATAEVVGDKGTYMASKPGRGAQIAAGIAAGSAPWVWVLHADARPSAECLAYLAALQRDVDLAWGRFDVSVPGLAMIGWFMNLRSRLTKICTGDQAMFFARPLLERIGGFPAYPLMEDIEVSRLLKHAHGSVFYAPRVRVGASDRRWRRHGIMTTVLFMWWVRLRFFFGASPEILYQSYYGK